MTNNIRSIAKNWLLKHPKLYLLYKQGFFRVFTANFRTFPDFLIIGAAKCGTTSLYDYIVQHPDIYPALRKETKFFDVDYNLGITWYRSNFPTYVLQFFREKIQKKKFLTGEATPGYLHNYLCAKRVHQYLPNIKLIVILRNPIDRAYSDYQMRVRGKHETKQFSDVIRIEKNFLDEGYDLFKEEKYSTYGPTFRPYLTRGHYYEQLQPWLELFPKENFLFIKTEDLDQTPKKILDIVFDFLDVTKFEIVNLKRKNVGKYNKLDKQLRSYLIAHFKKHNEKLEQFLGMQLEWDK